MNVRKYLPDTAAGGTGQTALKAADVGILQIEPEAGCTRGEGAICAHLGLPPDCELGLQTVLDRIPEPDRLQLCAQITAWRKGEPASADFSTQIADGLAAARTLRIRVVEADKALFLVTTRELLAQPDVLRAVSHALRSPLNALLGWVHVLALKRADDEEIQDLDHLKRGKFRLEKRPFKVAESIEAAIQAQQDAAAMREIQLVAQIAGDCDCGVEGDPLRLRQLFEHLLRNAIHHSDARSQVRVSCERHEAQLQIKVIDTGSGLTRAQIEALFHDTGGDIPFESPGLGAGLRLAREIARRHRGTIFAESAGLGKGLTVVVTLPARVREEQKKAG